MKKLLYIFSMAALFFSCTEKKLEPFNSASGKPEPVTDVSVEHIPGGAVISFVIPRDENVLSVKAVYTLTNGTKRESVTSFYGNSLKIEGYNDVSEHEALLYTVSRAQELSDPLPVKFTPLQSPLSKTAESTNISSDFGGAYFSWKNDDKVLLTAEMLAATDNGEMRTARIETSTLDSAFFSIRGYDPTPRKFAIVFRDNWDNVSDTVYPREGFITPWVEAKLDKKIWSIFKISSSYLPGDVTFTNFEGREEYMFDDDINTFGHSSSGSLPVNITIDIGGEARLSRVLFFQRYAANNGTYYNWGNPRRVIVYGRKDAPATGNWNEWTELVDYTMIKPSGTNSDFSICTDEDMQAAKDGHEAPFPISSEAYRYLRFRFMTSWENRPYAHPAEITLYGEYAE
jgi:hypothetical protein